MTFICSTEKKQSQIREDYIYILELESYVGQIIEGYGYIEQNTSEPLIC